MCLEKGVGEEGWVLLVRAEKWGGGGKCWDSPRGGEEEEVKN